MWPPQRQWTNRPRQFASKRAADAGAATRLTVARAGAGVTVERLVGPQRVIGTYDPTRLTTATAGLNGASRIAKTRWEGLALVIEETEVVPQPVGTATVTVTERWALQSDGTLHLEVTSDTGQSTITRTYTYIKATQ